MQTEIIKRNNSSSSEVDLIEVREGKAVTSSLVVAEYFGKAHKDVLRAIKSLDCSELFNQLWGIERSGFFNGRGKWAKGFENQRV